MKALFNILLLFFFSVLSAQVNVVVLTDSLKSFPVNENATFAIYKAGENLDVSKKQRWLSYLEFSAIKSFSASEKTVICKVNVINNSAQKQFFVHADDYVPHLQMYEILQGKLAMLGETGFKISRRELSVEKDIQDISLKINPGENKTLIFRIDSYKNELVFNPIRILSKEEFLRQNNVLNFKIINESSPLILFFVGIHCCLFILAISRLGAKYFLASIIIFIFINLFYIFYYSADYNFINLENKLLPNLTNNDYVNFFGALEPALYYVFFWSYLDKNRIFRRFILFSGIFWVLFYFLTNLEWKTLKMVESSRFFRHFGPVYDLIITGTVFIFLLKYKSTFHKYARLGVFVLLLSAVQLSYPFILGLLGILVKPPRFIDENSYFIMYTAIVVDFMLFLYGQNKNELEIQAEKEQIEKQLLQTEVERQKSIIKERRRIALDMHDDLGAGISAIKLNAEYLKKKVTDKNIIDDINDLVKTSEDMNLSMREMLWSLNYKNDNISDFVQYSTIYAENFFRKTNIKLVVSSDRFQNTSISAENRRNLFLCFKEALNNIYKHSGAKHSFLSFVLENQTLIIDIKDDGIGLNPDKLSGNGLENVKTRMSNVGGSLKIIEEKGGLHLQLIYPYRV